MLDSMKGTSERKVCQERIKQRAGVVSPCTQAKDIGYSPFTNVPTHFRRRRRGGVDVLEDVRTANAMEFPRHNPGGTPPPRILIQTVPTEQGCEQMSL